MQGAIDTMTNVSVHPLGEAPFRFLNLPGEVRNSTYEYLFVDSTLVVNLRDHWYWQQCHRAFCKHAAGSILKPALHCIGLQTFSASRQTIQIGCKRSCRRDAVDSRELYCSNLRLSQIKEEQTLSCSQRGGKSVSSLNTDLSSLVGTAIQSFFFDLGDWQFITKLLY